MATDQNENGNIDLKRFNEVFFEECSEHLAEVEQILLALGDRHPDQEQLNAIFRAAHSIKGGAGIFGFEDMTVVTHVMESLLDRLRNEELPFGNCMLDLLLEAGDVISMQLAGHRDGAPVCQEAVDAVRLKLQSLIDGGLQSQEAGLEPDPAVTSASRLRRYQILFTPEADVFTRGFRLENIIGELKTLAEPESFSSRALLPSPEELPELEEFDPESCLTRWCFTMTTKASVDEIMDVFMFVAEEEQLIVRELMPDEAGAHAFAPTSGPAEPAPQAQTLQPQAPQPQAPQAQAPQVQAPQAQAPHSQAPPAPPAATADETEGPAPFESSHPGRRAYDLDPLAPGAYGRRKSDQDSSIRVNVTKVDQLINQVGELLITQAMLVQIAAGLDPVRFEALHKSVTQLERNSRDLQGSVMSIRLVPIGLVFNRFPRMVRELAAKLGKTVELKTVGENTELDKGLIEKIADPLSHLVRNSLDHGLETAERRLALGKPASGTIQLKASQQGGRIVIEVSDDGAGLNRERILAKARERGIPCSEAMSDEEVWQLIFTPGFSTAESITEVSGRGVGMDVVLKNVQSIGGRIQITSQAGRGSCVTISLPLTLAILNGLSVAVGGEKFIIALNSVIESLQPKPEQLKTVNGREVLAVRGDYLPIIRLHELFDIENAVHEAQAGILVLVELDGDKAALQVDALLDEQQVVVKSLEDNYRKVEGSSGATILGDGRVALILDIQELLDLQRRGRPEPGDNKEAA